MKRRSEQILITNKEDSSSSSASSTSSSSRLQKKEKDDVKIKRRKQNNAEAGLESEKKEHESSTGLVNGNMYFTKVDILPDCFNEGAFDLSDILSLTRPLLSLHCNFMIDVDWLLQMYPPACRSTPICLVVGEKMGTDAPYLRKLISRNPSLSSSITVCSARLPIPFGTHHTKLSILESEDSIHVVVSTANLVSGDWGAKTQCFYYARGRVNHSDSSSSKSLFRDDLIDYLDRYNLQELDYWKDRLRSADFEGLADRIVCSVPGYHTGNTMNKTGHLLLRSMLSSLPSTATAVPSITSSSATSGSALDAISSRPSSSSSLFLAQCSSIGSLGPTASAWLATQFRKTLQGNKAGESRFFLIYPTVEDVRGSIEGYQAGGSLPYSKKTEEKQKWLKSMMCKWRSEMRGRSRAMPHVKTYCELINGHPKWLLLTSANLSKAAWGDLQKNNTQLMVRSYELGVLLTDANRIKIPYDYPILKYSSTDEPWICDISYMKEDNLGETYILDH